MFNRLLIILILLGFSACKKNDSPRLVAENFLEAMSERKYEEASKYSTVETQKLLKQLEKIELLSGTSDDMKPGKVTIVLEEIEGKKATVFFKEEGNDLEQKISLKKVTDSEGNLIWKVALKKEELKLNRDAILDINRSSTNNSEIPS